MAKPIRTERIAEEIRKIVSEYLISGAKDRLSGFVTINHVVVSRDLSQAKIYFSVFGSSDEVKATSLGIKELKPALRKQVAQAMRLRHVPDLVFMYDDTVEKAARIDKLLNDTNQ